MLIVNNEKNNAMTIVAKDTGEFTLQLEGYEFQEGDTVTFTVNNVLEGKKPFIQIVVDEFTDGNCATVKMNQEDTDIEVGDYLYDIQLDTIDGRRDTVVGPSKFKVIGGVTY